MSGEIWPFQNGAEKESDGWDSVFKPRPFYA